MKNLAGKVSHLLIAGMLVMAGCGGGDKGDPGAKGENGIPGTNGTNGAPGGPGATGDAGLKGANGTNGNNGTNGTTGDAGLSTGTVSLTITNSITNTAVPGATVTLAPTGTIAIDGTTGKSSATSLAIGDYTLTIKATGYTTGSQDIEVVAGLAQAITIKLVPTANVAATITANVTTAQAPGATVNLTASSTIYDGSTSPSYTWKQISGPTATITPGSDASKAAVTIPTDAAIQTALQTALQSQVDPTPPARLDVVGINPYALGIATAIVVQVTSTTTTSGTNTEATTNTISIPLSPTTRFTETSGLRNVPIGVPQLLEAGPLPTGTGAATAWAWTVSPADSSTLVNPTSQFPIFTPKPAGNVQQTYVLTEASTGGKLTMYAGLWAASNPGTTALDKTNVNSSDVPQPKAPSSTCGQCHKAGGQAPNVWSEYSQTGHAVIVPENIDVAGGHWTFTACGLCHSVGYNTSGIGGSNDLYQAILAKEPSFKIPTGSVGSYYSMLTSTDTTAGTEIKQFAGTLNVQCENCHGPNQSDGHNNVTNGVANDPLARRNLKADVCGQCHGEPLHHGRYQEWQRSKHSNLTVAIGRAVDPPVDSTKKPLAPPTDATNCSSTGTINSSDPTALSCQGTWANPITNGNMCTRCHTGEGFVLWQDQSTARNMDFNKNIQNSAGTGDATLADVVLTYGLTKSNVHSQTCQTCHDPHDVGMTSGLPNTTNVRVSDDIAMLPSGFPAAGLGKGSLCATCHNSRNGVHNDSNTYIPPGAQVSLGSVHDSTAAEVLLGQNMYFVTPGQRGGHSYIQDTCVNCHMRLTPPPTDLSNSASTNHTFGASLTICTNCHGAFDGGSIQTATKASLTNLLNFIGNGIKQNFNTKLSGKVVWVLARRNMTDTTAAYSHKAAVNTALINTPSNAFKDLTPYNVKLDLSTNSVTAIDMIEDNTTFKVTVASPISIAWVSSSGATITGVGTESVTSFYISLTTMRSDDGTGTVASSALDGTEYPISLVGNTMKALWNYISLNREGSFGIHNPGFTNQVIGATMAQDLTK